MRGFILVVGLFAAAIVAHAQGITSMFPGPGTPAASGSSFTGVGDVSGASGAKIWVGVVPYNAAYALAGGNALDWSCNSGANTGTLVFTSAGALNTSPLSVCSGTISVTQLYDSSGQTFCTAGAAKCSLSIVASGSISLLTSGCPATSVITYCLSATGVDFKSVPAPDTSQPFTISVVYDRPTSAQGSYRAAMYVGGAGTGSGVTNNTAFQYAQTAIPTIAMSDNALHTLQSVINGTSSSFLVDNAGSPTTVSTSPGTGGLSSSGAFHIGGANPFSGFWYQGGAWTSALGSSTQVAVAHNECLNTGSTSGPTC